MKLAVVVCLFLINVLSVSNSIAANVNDDPHKPLDPIIISSSRIPTTVEHSITNTVVIDRAVIDKSNARSVSELLRTQTGIHVQQNGSRGGVGSVYLRNSDPSLLMVIVDGVKVNDPTNSRGGSFDFSSIDINSVESIEIVKGSMSSVYGSDAISGVIYITSRSIAADPHSQLTLTAGTKHYQEATAQVQQKINDVDISLSVGYLDEGNPIAFSSFINRYANFNATSFSEGRKLKVFARYNDSNAKSLPDDSGGDEFAVIRESDQRDVINSIFGWQFSQDVASDWSYTFSFSEYRHRERVNSPGVAPGIRDPFGIPANTSDSELKRDYIAWSNNIEFSPKLQVNLGLDLQREIGVSDSTLDTGMGIVAGSYDLKRQNNGFFAEALFRYSERLSSKLGIRYDDPDEFSNETTANFGLRYAVNHYILTASIGSGFKLPSFFSLGNPIVGNANLVPEKSIYWELGLRQPEETLGFAWSVTIYAYEFDELIDFDAGPPPSLVNRSEATSEGVDFELTKTIANRQLSAGISYSESNIVGSSEKLLNRPLWRVTGQYLHQYSDDLNSNLTLLYVDEVYDSSVPTGEVKLDSYYRLDLSVNWQYSKTWQIKGIVENILDEEYQQTIGTESPGIMLRISTSAKF